MPGSRACRPRCAPSSAPLPSFAEAWPDVERGLVDTEAAFRRAGPQLDPIASPLPEFVHRRHQVVIGARMVANRKVLFESERARIKAATKDGLSIDDQARRLDELRRAILKAAAKRELLMREAEADGEFLPRPTIPS